MMTWVVSFFFSCFIYFKLPRKKNETRGDRNIPNDRSKITENRPPPPMHPSPHLASNRKLAMKLNSIY